MACLGATTGICTGHTTDEGCVAPKTYNAAFPSLEHVHLSYDGTKFIAEWDTGTSYPTHIVRGYIRPADTPYFLSNGISYVSRDTGTIDLVNGVVTGGIYRLTLRTESGTEYCRCVTVEVKAEVFTDYPLGEDLVEYGPDEVFFDSEYVYA